MDSATSQAEVIDFDLARLEACSRAERAEVLHEARLLASAFGADSPAKLRSLADQMDGDRPRLGLDFARTRLLAAALKRLATGA